VVPLKPKLSNINPASGFKRLFSRRSLVELTKSIIKLGVIAMVSYLTLRGRITEELVPLMGMSVWEIISYIASVSYLIMLRVVLIMAVMAVLDFLYQRWEYEDSLKMTKQEVRDEYRQMEGDPLIKGHIRRLQLEYSRKRMMLDIPDADVVVTNPIHYAVALRYKRDLDPAPVVLAKGARLLAERIKEIASQSGIPVVENQELARALYKNAEVGVAIPEDLFSSVAEVLAYVYRLNQGRQGAQPLPAN
jgi:flagellar biosynthetic protein FlhB